MEKKIITYFLKSASLLGAAFFFNTSTACIKLERNFTPLNVIIHLIIALICTFGLWNAPGQFSAKKKLFSVIALIPSTLIVPIVIEHVSQIFIFVYLFAVLTAWYLILRKGSKNEVAI